MEFPKLRDLKASPLAYLAQEFRPYRGRLMVVLLLGVAVSLIQPVCVKLVERIIDNLQKGVDDSFFRTTPLTLVGLFAISGFAKFFYNTLRREVSERVILKLREDLFHCYLKMPMGALHSRRAGEMLSGVQNDLAQVNVGIDTFCDLLKEPVAFIGLLGVAFYADWKLALATLCVVPFAGYLFGKSGNAVKKYSASNLSHFGDIMALSQETLVGAFVVKIFKLEKVLSKKFEKMQSNYFGALWKSIRIQEIATPSVEFIGALLMAAVLIYGGYQISSGAMTSGQLLGFVFAIGLAQMPLKKLNNAFLKIRIAEAAADRIYNLLNDRSLKEMGSGTKRFKDFVHGIEYKNVYLNYGTKTALKDISFRIQQGQRIALVGRSGSGKSSIVSLLPRLFEVSSGSIEIDGVNIREFWLDDLRGAISAVTQETFLFNDTIYENIRYGRPDATRQEVLAAAEAALCTEFIERFEEGFETKVGDRGCTLSGGERQRVAIARAILKQAPILILDEATSNLDSQSEAKVQTALEHLMEGRTTLIVAHRLATVRQAHKILVVEEGQIVEKGSHTELIEKNGRYQRYVQQQMV